MPSLQLFYKQHQRFIAVLMHNLRQRNNAILICIYARRNVCLIFAVWNSSLYVFVHSRIKVFLNQNYCYQQPLNWSLDIFHRALIPKTSKAPSKANPQKWAPLTRMHTSLSKVCLHSRFHYNPKSQTTSTCQYIPPHVHSNSPPADFLFNHSKNKHSDKTTKESINTN